MSSTPSHPAHSTGQPSAGPSSSPPAPTGPTTAQDPSNTTPARRAVRRALLSVSDKAGIVEFARALADRGVQILSTGGTAATLTQAGIPVTEVGEYTGFPEIMDGRVKTLHPKVHGGLLARRDRPAHMQAIESLGIGPIDLLAVNLYPFDQTIARPDCTFEDGIENIDIGGPAMLRAAAKNHDGVTVVVDPQDYARVLAQLDEGGVDAGTRRALATKVFAHTARYDGAIAAWLSSMDEQAGGEQAPRTGFPRTMTLQLQQVQTLRYGENPHQQAAFYREASPPAGTLATGRALQGKELSYNNIADADAAWECVRAFAECACVIVKHANPCGVAIARDPLAAYRRAFETDPTSAFGGIIAFNRPVDADTARAVCSQFVEVVIAPSFSDEARAQFATKANVRLLEIPLPAGATVAAMAGAASDLSARPATLDYKRVGGGLLVQSADHHILRRDDVRVVTAAQPTEAQWADLLFAWQVAHFVKSNAIVFCGDHRTLGIGAGQMSRVDSARIASIKAEAAGLSLQRSVVASDAFFPFRDGLDVVADAGATAVIQPGGSVRDEEVIAAANERGVVMLFTGVRHFRH